MRAKRTAVALCMVLALAAAIYLTFDYGSPVYIGPVVGTISLTWVILQLTYSYWKGARTPLRGPSTPGQVKAAARWLAGAVAGSWRKEAATRRITVPDPVPVRWQWAAGGLSPGEAESPPFPGAGPSALPGPARPGPIPTSGVVTELHELYRSLPRGRLVITGEPGSGKTAAMILLLLEALDWRERLAADERPKAPVPVLLPLAGWDPETVPLSVWAVSVLNRDYPALRSPLYGSNAASELISAGHVALFLDGLDEMPGSLRSAALRRLNTEVPDLRIVMTSRPAEYTEATDQAPLEGSAVIELLPVQPATAAKFLLGEPPARSRAAWRKVADYIRANPDSAAAKALGKPLNLTMARDAYSAGDPAGIVNSSSSPVEDRITGHLIDQFLPGQCAQRWLTCLARHLDDREGQRRHDLEWWRLGGILRRRTRIMAVASAAFAVGTLANWIIGIPLILFIKFPANLHMIAPERIVSVLLGGPATGLIFGVTFGLAYAIVTVSSKAMPEPSQIPLRPPGPRAMARALHPSRSNTTRAASGFLGGFIGGCCYAILQLSQEKLVYGVPILSMGAIRETIALTAGSGLLLGSTVGISFFVIGVLEEQSDTGAVTPLGLLAGSRSRALFQMAIFAPLLAIIVATTGWLATGSLEASLRGPLVLTPDSWPDQLLVGGVIGIAGTILYILAFTAWGQWLLLARIALPLTGRLPWRLTGFLQDAYDRGILRQAGAVYQFRHHTLQSYLINQGSRIEAPAPVTGASVC